MSQMKHKQILYGQTLSGMSGLFNNSMVHEDIRYKSYVMKRGEFTSPILSRRTIWFGRTQCISCFLSLELCSRSKSKERMMGGCEPASLKSPVAVMVMEAVNNESHVTPLHFLRSYDTWHHCQVRDRESCPGEAVRVSAILCSSHRLQDTRMTGFHVYNTPNWDGANKHDHIKNSLNAAIERVMLNINKEHKINECNCFRIRIDIVFEAVGSLC